MKPPFFQAQWGDVITNTPYRRPNLESFTNWWNGFKDISGLEDYKVNLIGSFCEKHFGKYEGTPKDVDVVLTGPIKDEEKLKYILSHGVKVGFENKILVDFTWASTLHSYEKWSPFCRIRIGKSFSKILGDNFYSTDYVADEEYRLESGLWQFCYQDPPNSWFKSFHRYTDGDYLGITADVRKMFD